jgi:hypothetical protein
MNDTQLFLAIGMPTLAVLTGILVNHGRSLPLTPVSTT